MIGMDLLPQNDRRHIQVSAARRQSTEGNSRLITGVTCFLADGLITSAGR
jgi:hypothetical protein